MEINEVAHKTLRLRSFYRQFEHGEIPDDYYEFIQQPYSFEALNELLNGFNEGTFAKQGKNVLHFLKEAIKSIFAVTPYPKLIGKAVKVYFIYLSHNKRIVYHCNTKSYDLFVISWFYLY